MSEIIKFSFEEQAIEVQLENGEPIWRATGVCAILGYADAAQAVQDHVDPDDTSKRRSVNSRGLSYSTNWINESGLYSLIFGSKLPRAKAFKRWVTSEVLPTIRKTGGFGQSTELAIASKIQEAMGEMMGELTRLHVKIDELERARRDLEPSSCIRQHERSAIAHHVRDVATRLVAVGDAPSKRSAITAVYNRLAGACEWSGTGRSWDFLPPHKYGIAITTLVEMRRGLEARQKGKGRGQMELKTVLPFSR